MTVLFHSVAVLSRITVAPPLAVSATTVARSVVRAQLLVLRIGAASRPLLLLQLQLAMTKALLLCLAALGLVVARMAAVALGLVLVSICLENPSSLLNTGPC